jgi:pSer/pThr/pTyr-binding forkhead associated (FHA) protein
MEVKLLVTNEKSRTREVRLGPETVIGRARECHLRIVSGQVSRRHCVIRVEDNRVVVRDLGSANGTEVDGATIPPEIDVPVTSGSLLVIGPLKFMFEFLSQDLAEPDGDDLQSTTQDISPLPGKKADKDIDDTKDYGPSVRQARFAPAAPAEPDSSEVDLSEGMPDSPVAVVGAAPAIPAEGSSRVTFEDTVYDNEMADRAREAAERAHAADKPLETGTDFMAGESAANSSTSRQKDATPPDVASFTPPVAEIPSMPPGSAREPDAAQHRKGWKLLDFLHRKTGPGETAAETSNPTESSAPAENPADPATSQAAPSTADDPALEEFFKRFEP